MSVVPQSDSELHGYLVFDMASENTAELSEYEGSDDGQGSRRGANGNGNSALGYYDGT